MTDVDAGLKVGRDHVVRIGIGRRRRDFQGKVTAEAFRRRDLQTGQLFAGQSVDDPVNGAQQRTAQGHGRAVRNIADRYRKAFGAVQIVQHRLDIKIGCGRALDGNLRRHVQRRLIGDGRDRHVQGLHGLRQIVAVHGGDGDFEVEVFVAVFRRRNRQISEFLGGQIPRAVAAVHTGRQHGTLRHTGDGDADDLVIAQRGSGNFQRNCVVFETGCVVQQQARRLGHRVHVDVDHAADHRYALPVGRVFRIGFGCRRGHQQ